MLGFFKRKKKTMNEPHNTATPAGPLPVDPRVLAKLKIPRKFEIFVEEFDEEKGWKPVVSANIPGTSNSNPVITVTCPQDLQEKMNLYKSMEQRFKIIREIDPPSRETIERLAAEQGIDIETGMPLGEAPAGEPAAEQAQAEGAPKASPTLHVRRPAPTLPSAPAPRPRVAIPKAKPKVVTIGDVQIKYDGDKVFQRQWIKLNAAEARNFRVVSDASNKIVPLAGKHIEALKWVQVEETESADDDSAERLLDA